MTVRKTAKPCSNSPAATPPLAPPRLKWASLARIVGENRCQSTPPGSLSCANGVLRKAASSGSAAFGGRPSAAPTVFGACGAPIQTLAKKGRLLIRALAPLLVSIVHHSHPRCGTSCPAMWCSQTIAASATLLSRREREPGVVEALQSTEACNSLADDRDASSCWQLRSKAKLRRSFFCCPPTTAVPVKPATISIPYDPAVAGASRCHFPKCAVW
jgi:hypothetical protein